MNTATQNGHKTARTLEDLVREHEDAKTAVTKARATEKTKATTLAKAAETYNAAHLTHTQAQDRLDDAQATEAAALKARREAERRVA